MIGPQLAPPPSSLSELLPWAQRGMAAAGVDSPWLTALVLLELVTGLGREAALAHPEKLLTADDVHRFATLVERRCAREPLAYLLGYREFFGRTFAVDRSTLIPRPETEGVVQLALDRIDQLGTEGPLRLLDVGTGSGAIAVTLLTQKPQLTAVGTDIDLGALAIARRNAASHEVSERLRLVATALADALNTTFPLIVANLPYIPTADIDALEPEVRCYEPRAALDGGPDGTEIVGRFLSALPVLLGPTSMAILEIGEGQGDNLRQRASDSMPGAAIGVERDAAGLDRYLVVERSS